MVALSKLTTLPTSMVPGAQQKQTTDAAAERRAGLASAVRDIYQSREYIAQRGITTPGDKDIPDVDGDGIYDNEEITVTGSTANRNTARDSRVRISAQNEQQVYGPNDRTANILAPLYATGGLLFPYTPQVQVSGDTEWSGHSLTHTNFDVLSYQRTASASISLSGKFTVQNQREGEYALAVLHFLRVAGKMYFGDLDSAQRDAQNRDTSNAIAGLPPPALLLNGYGDYMFNNLKCVLKNYTYAFDENMDMIDIVSPAGGTVSLPPLFNISLSLGLQTNPSKTRKQFSLNAFRTGKLMTDGGWF